ncbi:ROK family protein [Paucibacter sp. JuS9]|uniref:ROK family protein n=1 Tax=Paucibacter sp. JuS9 TaxID=3228748 RepID=UPI003757D090
MNALPLVLAADIGGTKILAAAVDAAGQVCARCRLPTEAERGGAHVLKQIQQALQQVQAELPADLRPGAIGLSAAGVIDASTARVIDATAVMPGWAGTDLRATLGQAFGLPVQALNDVHAALVGEQWLGALADAPQASALMLTLGTGLGGALTLGHGLWSGHRQLAGHAGRMEVLHKGQRVSLDRLISGSGLARLMREHGGVAEDGRATLAALDAGDARAQAALDEWISLLALQIDNLFWLLDPARIVIGGGMLDARTAWWPQLQSALRVPVQPEAAKLGNEAGLLGAAHRALAGEAAR